MWFVPNDRSAGTHRPVPAIHNGTCHVHRLRTCGREPATVGGMDPHVRSALARGHGVASWRILQAAGMTRAELRQAVRAGTLRPVRRGWYATDSAHHLVVQAVSAGGVLSCVSALALRGVWIPETCRNTTHVRATETAHRTSKTRFCRQHGRPQAEDGSVDDVPTSLRHAIRCLDEESIVIMLDSILNLRLLSFEEITELLRDCPGDVRALLDKTDRAESGTETMVRLRLRARNLGLTPQVTIPGIGRVDFLVGHRLIIEVDGAAFHLSAHQYERDHHRDLVAHALNYIPLRLTYAQVVYEWEECESMILAITRRREHLRQPQRWESPANLGTNPTG